MRTFYILLSLAFPKLGYPPIVRFCCRFEGFADCNFLPLGSSGGFSIKIRGAEVLNLPSILEVVRYLSSTSQVCVFHKRKASRKIETTAETGFLFYKIV